MSGSAPSSDTGSFQTTPSTSRLPSGTRTSVPGGSGSALA
jgi:hypothetical protein